MPRGGSNDKRRFIIMKGMVVGRINPTGTMCIIIPGSNNPTGWVITCRILDYNAGGKGNDRRWGIIMCTVKCIIMGGIAVGPAFQERGDMNYNAHREL